MKTLSRFEYYPYFCEKKLLHFLDLKVPEAEIFEKIAKKTKNAKGSALEVALVLWMSQDLMGVKTSKFRAASGRKNQQKRFMK